MQANWGFLGLIFGTDPLAKPGDEPFDTQLLLVCFLVDELKTVENVG